MFILLTIAYAIKIITCCQTFKASTQQFFTLPGHSVFLCRVFLIASLGTSSPGHKGESQDVTREPQVSRDSTMRAFLACTCFLVAHLLAIIEELNLRAGCLIATWKLFGAF